MGSIKTIKKGDPVLYDAIVIGAGPAGALSSAILTEKGLKVLLIDKHTFPREKTCGGLISKKAIELLPSECDYKKFGKTIYKINLMYPDKTELTYKSNNFIGIIVKRRDFDSQLVEIAQDKGTLFLQNCHYTNHEQERGYYKLYTDKGIFKTNYLIGADGFFSQVARQSGLRKKWARWECGLAISAQVPIEYLPNVDENAVKFIFPKVLGGMSWCFPGKEFINIGVGGWRLDANNIIETFKNIISTTTKKSQIYPHIKIKGAFLPAGGRTRKIAKDRVLLVGDAAGLVDSFSGEGIFYALQSAKIAAEIILQENTGDSYQRKCYKLLLDEFRYSALISILLGDRLKTVDKNLQKRLCHGFYQIMTQSPSQNRYRKLFAEALPRSVSLRGPFLWIKRLFYD